MSANVGSIFNVREVPWHGLGIKIMVGSHYGIVSFVIGLQKN